MAPEHAAARPRRVLSANPARVEEWRAFHLYYHDSLDVLLGGLVEPLARGLLADGLASTFHHYRYHLGGPHVRLRVRPGAAGGDAVAERVRSAAAAFFAEHPSTTRVPDGDILERNRILAAGSEANRPWRDTVFPADSVDEQPWSPRGEPFVGPSTIAPVLELFAASSIAALGHRLPASAPAGARLPHVGRLLLRHAWGLCDTPGELMRLLGYAEGFGPEVAPEVARLADEAFERGGDRLCDLLRSEIEALAGRSGEEEPGGKYLLADASLAFMREIASSPAERRHSLAVRQMHMTANRCGLGNREEAYLTRILRLAADRVASTRGAEWDAAWRARSRQAPAHPLAEVVRRGTAAFVAGVRGASGGSIPTVRVAAAEDGTASPRHADFSRPADLLRRAGEIADAILARPLTADGEIAWTGEAVVDDDGAERGPHLYDGAPGIALFLAALDRARGTTEHREAVLETIRPFRGALRRLARSGGEDGFPIGGVAGVGSWIYALVRLGGLLDEPELVGDAHDVAALLTPRRIADDAMLDVVLGSAGALLALLALDEADPRARRSGAAPLEVAVRCGEHLLGSAVAAGPGRLAWPCAERVPAPGFAHGASGVAHALARLHLRTGEARWLRAALEGFRYERDLFDPAAGGWVDPARPGRAATGWCRGAAGIALARLGALECAPGDGELAADLAAAVRLAGDPDAESGGTLCCGAMGRADVLAAAARAASDPAPMERARALAEAADAAWEGGHRGLFPGLAGAGLTLVRLADPAAVPSPLGLA